jgi:hypothetical protein
MDLKSAFTSLPVATVQLPGKDWAKPGQHTPAYLRKLKTRQKNEQDHWEPAEENNQSGSRDANSHHDKPKEGTEHIDITV